MQYLCPNSIIQRVGTEQRPTARKCQYSRVSVSESSFGVSFDRFWALVLMYLRVAEQLLTTIQF